MYKKIIEDIFWNKLTPKQREEVWDELRKLPRETMGEKIDKELDTCKITHKPSTYSSTDKPALNFLLHIYPSETPIIDIDITKLKTALLMMFNDTPPKAALFERRFRKFFKDIFEDGLTEKNLFPKKILPQIQEKEVLAIDLHDLKKVIPFEKYEQLKLIYQFGFYTGLRRSNIIGLRFTEVDFGKMKIRILNTKNKRYHEIPILSEVESILIERHRVVRDPIKGFVFCWDNGTPLRGDFLSKRFKKCVRQAAKVYGINPDLHFHSLRAGCGSHYLRLGVDVKTVSKLLGHSNSIVTENHYLAITTEDLRKKLSLNNSIGVN